MSHQRIIGLIVLGCLFLLVLPFLSSEHKIDNSDISDQDIIVPEVNTDSAQIKEITIEKYEDVASAKAPAELEAKSDLTAPAIAPVTGLSGKPPASDSLSSVETKKSGWYVQIASLKESNPIKIESLKSSLRKLNVEIETEKALVDDTKFIRIKSKVLASKEAALKERDRINENLKYKKIQAIIKHQ